MHNHIEAKHTRLLSPIELEMTIDTVTRYHELILHTFAECRPLRTTPEIDMTIALAVLRGAMWGAAGSRTVSHGDDIDVTVQIEERAANECADLRLDLFKTYGTKTWRVHDTVRDVALWFTPEKLLETLHKREQV